MDIQEKDKKEKILIEKYGEFSAESIRKHLRESNSSVIRSQYSIKESAAQIAQKTDRCALDRIAEIVRSKMQEIKARIADNSNAASVKDADEHQIVTLTLEEIDVGDFNQRKTNNNMNQDSKENLPKQSDGHDQFERE